MASGAAKRYTEAVFSLAREKGSFDQWQRDLDALAGLMDDRAAAEVLASPNIGRADKLSLIRTALQGAQPETLNLATLLLDRGRLAIAPEMARMFRDAALAELGIVVAEVTTAAPVDKQAEAAIRQRLSSLVGKQVEVRTVVNPSIIGGIVARIGDQLIDGSVSNQLRRLRNRLEAGA
jgi:F-type H+-transporting ATPase subunit delta